MGSATGDSARPLYLRIEQELACDEHPQYRRLGAEALTLTLSPREGGLVGRRLLDERGDLVDLAGGHLGIGPEHRQSVDCVPIEGDLPRIGGVVQDTIDPGCSLKSLSGCFGNQRTDSSRRNSSRSETAGRG